jgi:probable FeS assembly SUF system protein SufT
VVTREARTLSRDVEGAAIPYGDRLTLAAGTTVYITQALGGSYTAMTDHGYLVRIEGKDADAIGETPTQPISAESAAGRSTKDLAWEQLRSCYDPEIPVNIVDLGLIYDVAIKPERVDVKMTLTALGCPMAADVMADVRDHLMTLPGIQDAGVDIVYEPVWTPERMSEEARWELGMV